VNTSTPTATATAGMTLTPSLTPRLSLTPSPTYPPDVPDGAEELRVSGQIEPTDVHYRTPRPSYPEMGDILEAYAEGDCKRVLELVEQVEALDTITTFAEIYYYQAMCLAQEGRYGQAEIAALKGRDEDADAAIFPAALGYIYLQMGSPEALTQSQRAVQLDPYLKLPVITLARYYGEQGEYNQGLREIARLQERRPYDAELILEKGKLYLMRGDPGDALYQANFARHIDPLNAEAMKLQARAALALDDPGGAVLAMRDLLFYYPDSVEGYRILGDARAAEGNINLALEAYGRALNAPEVSAEVGRTYVARGQLYATLGRHAEAYTDFDKAANILTPPPTEALEGRVAAAIATGRIRSALEDIETLLEREPERQEWRVLQARLLIEQEDYEEAGEILVELLDRELQDDLRDDVLDYAARIDYHLAMEEDPPDPQLLETALASNNNALIVEETAGRRYYRALILDALDRDAQALRELEWLTFWDRLYDYAFADDVQERIAALTE
jgi:tetratricopeptide (TPR) repeat protein